MLPIVIALSVLVGLSLGMLGGGGSILTLPILVYGMGMEEKAAIATSLLVVAVTSAVAMLSHAAKGNVEWKIGLLFAAAGSVGAFLGGLAAGGIPGAWLMLGFMAIMVATAFAMIRGRKEVEARPPAPWPKLALQGLGVGFLSGLVGAGGGFLVVPALALLGGLPMKRAVGTSLLVIAINSMSGFIGHSTHVQVDLVLAAEVSAAAIVGSLLGGLASSRVPAPLLRQGFGVFVLFMAAFMGVKELGG